MAVVDGQKRPTFRAPGWQAGKYFDRHTVDVDTMIQHWSGFDGLCVHTGRSKIVVLDIDVHGQKNGFTALAAKGIRLPETFTVTTASGGRHHYFRARGGKRISHSLVADGVDIKCGESIVFGPSTTVNGRPYTPDTQVPEAESLPLFPVELIPKPPKPPIPQRYPVGSGPRRKYASAVLTNRCAEVASAAEGARACTLFAAAARVGGFVAGGSLGKEEAGWALVDAARDCGLPENEIFSTIRNGLARGALEPQW